MNKQKQKLIALIIALVLIVAVVLFTQLNKPAAPTTSSTDAAPIGTDAAAGDINQ